MFLKDSIFTFFRRVPPDAVISVWLSTYYRDAQRFFYRNPDKVFFRSSMRNDFMQYSPDESENVFEATLQLMQTNNLQDIGVFGLLAYAVKDILRLDGWRECLCRFSKLIEFRELSHPIGQEVFVAAFLAEKDSREGYQRRTFSFPPVVRTDNLRLHQMLNKGMAENHFHIGGSVHSSLYSWICLMNHMNCAREKEFRKAGLDTDPLNQSSAGVVGTIESFYSLTFKAACIRYFLFLRLHDTYPISDSVHPKRRGQRYKYVSHKFNNVKLTRIQRMKRKNTSEQWIAERMEAANNSLAFYMTDLESRLESCRCIYSNKSGDVYDYAIEDEPSPPMNDNDLWSSPDYAVRNYERRVYRSLAGEQRFQYKLFRAIYDNDKRIMPYADLAYAYLLIYCKFRSELIQSNKTVGFANFADYQDRKNNFSGRYKEYAMLRSRVAQQGVLLNPQIRTLEGRLIPTNKCGDLLKKITETYKEAVYAEADYDDYQKARIHECADQKLHYVLHFPKKKQNICPETEEGDLFEMLNCRNSFVRNSVEKGINAIIKLRESNPVVGLDNEHSLQPLTRITGIDACSNEIGCRPEVFAPAFRKIRYNCQEVENRLQARGADVLPVIRITYHVGEDFLDLTDGLRAIDEAIGFLKLDRGDRLGHAIALGNDPKDWYASKNYRIILPRQDLMDNMAWLLDKMHEYNLYDRAAENEIQKIFRENYREVILNPLNGETSMLSVDIQKYSDAMKLRGNDPILYREMPSESGPDYMRFRALLNEEAELQPWRVYNDTEKTIDWVASRLYHYYHFHPAIKRKGSEQIEYTVPYALIDVIAKVQKEMRYWIAKKDIGIETNPTSNYLIGTFRDYCNHPIFAFNDSGLYDNPDNPRMFVSINTDDLGVFDTSLENEYALMACALENRNEFLPQEQRIPLEKIYNWLDHIRQMGCDQSFRHVDHRNSI